MPIIKVTRAVVFQLLRTTFLQAPLFTGRVRPPSYYLLWKIEGRTWPCLLSKKHVPYFSPKNSLLDLKVLCILDIASEVVTGSPFSFFPHPRRETSGFELWGIPFSFVGIKEFPYALTWPLRFPYMPELALVGSRAFLRSISIFPIPPPICLWSRSAILVEVSTVLTVVSGPNMTIIIYALTP